MGADAMMHFGIKPKYAAGRRLGKLDTPGEPLWKEEVVTGSHCERERRDLKDQWMNGLMDDEDYKEALKDLYEQFLVAVRQEPLQDLSFPLPGNGAIMIQEGAFINEAYEHKVVTEGLRNVVTVRHLDPKEVKKEESKVKDEDGDVLMDGDLAEDVTGDEEGSVEGDEAVDSEEGWENDEDDVEMEE